MKAWFLFLVFVNAVLSLRNSYRALQSIRHKGPWIKRNFVVRRNNNEMPSALGKIAAPRFNKLLGTNDVCAGSVRLNKCVVSLSRRGADAAIISGQVTVNNRVASCGTMVKFGDVVRYEGKIQNWESGASARTEQPNTDTDSRKLSYVKYWKPVGVTCTADRSDRSNIISAGQFNLFPQRLFTVGRLDKDSSGLILLTSDGRVSNTLLNKKCKKEKTYLVEMNKRPTDDQLNQLRSGVVITTPLQREKSSRRTEITAKTLPCLVQRAPHNDKVLQFTLIEGRNRQIHRMAEVVGLLVVRLHRTSFAGITLKGLKEGDWLELSPAEMTIVRNAMGNTLSNISSET